ncbi:MAG: hypothetical protein OEU92_00220 [Alphaproteobacteria bacterium]|nr:hypothetical protein [Alphaproteobacteria bacterium]
MISKILFTIAVVVAIWKAFSMISRLSKSSGGGVPRPGKTSDHRQPDRPAEPKAVEMKPCPRCGAYVDPRQGCTCSTPGA